MTMKWSWRSWFSSRLTKKKVQKQFAVFGLFECLNYDLPLSAVIQKDVPSIIALESRNLFYLQ